ncbi:MAG: hypothetical protein ABIH55_00880 [Nanoarchaeota archaeon]|nr:hypothetical protein [Nanoarchaeota archaeon]MBU1135071.1 hypothetical protein [Nanoarchaeota archaeon]
MANKKLVDYIARQIKKGQTEAMTRRILLQHGWTKSAIIEGFSEAKRNRYGSYMDPIKGNKKPSKRRPLKQTKNLSNKYRDKFEPANPKHNSKTLKIVMVALIPLIIVLIVMLLFVNGLI